MKLERQVKHQADEIIKLQTKHAHQSQIKELKRVLHGSCGRQWRTCGGQQQQPQQFLLTLEAERQTPSFGQQTAEVVASWMATRWVRMSASELEQIASSTADSTTYSHAFGTDLTRNAVQWVADAVPINNSGH